MVTKSVSILPEIPEAQEGENLVQRLNKAFGPENWNFTVDAQFSGKESSGSVVTRGQLTVNLGDKQVIKPGVSAVPAQDDLNQSTQLGLDLAIISAFRRLGYSQLEYPELTWPEKKAYVPRDNSGPRPLKNPQEMTEEDFNSPTEDGSCADCGNEITAAKSSTGKFMSVETIRKMTMESYGRELCWECNKKAYGKAQNDNKRNNYRR